MKTTCPEVRERLSAWLDRELSREEHDQVAAHLEGCVSCSRELARLRALDAALGRLEAPVPPRLADRVLARVQPPKRPRSGWQSLALAASLVLGIVLGGMLARDFYPLASVSANGTSEVASLQEFHDFPQGSLGTVLASYQSEEGTGT